VIISPQLFKSVHSDLLTGVAFLLPYPMLKTTWDGFPVYPHGPSFEKVLVKRVSQRAGNAKKPQNNACSHFPYLSTGLVSRINTDK
jgi:hypothetical protein